MNKGELIDAIAKSSKLTKKDSQAALEALLKATAKTLKKGKKVSLIGWGTFSVAKRAARTGRNPQTGKALQIPAKKAVKFTVGSKLKKAVL